MKTRFSIVAILAAMCGCRAPHALDSAGELGQRTGSADASAARDASIQAAGMSRAMDDAGTSDPPVSELLTRAEQAIHAEQHVVARGHLQSILMQHPGHARAHHLLAVISDLDGRFTEAEEHYFAALTRDPQNANIVGDLGYSYYLQSRLEESEQYLRRALEFDPQHAGAAKNLAQLYSDRGEAGRAEHLLRSSLPSVEAELALSQLRQPSGAGIPRQTPESTGVELARQIQQELDAAARANEGALPRRDHEMQETSRSVAGSVDPNPRSDYEGVRINPWPGQRRAISPAGTQPAPSAQLADPGTPQFPGNDRRRTGSVAVADALPAINPIQNVGGQLQSRESGAVARAVGTRSAAETMPSADSRSESAGRRWPPATWAPLMGQETPGAMVEPPPYESRTSQAPQNQSGGIDQVSGTVNPWNTDVRHAIGQRGTSAVEQAYLEERSHGGEGPGAIQPVSAQGANTPAVISDGDGNQMSTPRSAPGTDWSGVPVLNYPGGPNDSFRSSTQSYHGTTNSTIASEYARSSTNRTSSRGTEFPTPSYEIPAYPRGPAADAPESPWPSRTSGADAASTGGTQETPNTGRSSTRESSPYRSDVVMPAPYRGRQSSSGL